MIRRCRSAAGTAAAFAAAAIAACGGGPAAPPPARPYADSGLVEAGGLRLHYALTPTLDLPPAVAGSYDVVQRRNLALLTVTIAPADATGRIRLDDARVAATAISLMGTRTTLAVTRHDEPGGPTWLAPVEVRHRVPMTIEIRARATGSGPEVRARLTREFRFD